jgi:hypothetical protein
MRHWNEHKKFDMGIVNILTILQIFYEIQVIS